MRGLDLILLACGLTSFVGGHMVSAEALGTRSGNAETAVAAPEPVESAEAELRTAIRGVQRTPHLAR